MSVLGERKSGVFVKKLRREVSAETPEPEGGVLDEKPRSVYEVVTRQMLMELKDDVAEVKGRVNTLLWVVLGATVVDFVMRLVR